MITLNFHNVEELIFYDRALQKRLPAHYFSLFEQWRLSIQMPMLRELGKKAVLDFLEQVGAEEILVLEEALGDKIEVERLNYRTVAHISVPLSDTKSCTCIAGFADFRQATTWRDDEQLHITFWR